MPQVPPQESQGLNLDAVPSVSLPGKLGDAHESGHRQAPGLSVESHLIRAKQTQEDTRGTARLTLHYVYNLAFFFDGF